MWVLNKAASKTRTQVNRKHDINARHFRAIFWGFEKNTYLTVICRSNDEVAYIYIYIYTYMTDALAAEPFNNICLFLLFSAFNLITDDER